MPRKTRGGSGRKPRPMESVTEKIPPSGARAGLGARVKRRGKSPPPGRQRPGHDKPHAVQGQTGTPGRLPGLRRKPGARPGYRSHARSARNAARGEAGKEGKSPGEMNDHRRGALSKRPGTEFGLQPRTKRGAPRETGAPLAFSSGSGGRWPSHFSPSLRNWSDGSLVRPQPAAAGGRFPNSPASFQT